MAPSQAIWRGGENHGEGGKREQRPAAGPLTALRPELSGARDFMALVLPASSLSCYWEREGQQVTRENKVRTRLANHVGLLEEILGAWSPEEAGVNNKH